MLNLKNKGTRGEYAVRDLLRGYGFKAQRTPLSGAIKGWEGDITTDFPWFIEVKNQQTTKFLQWYKKAGDQAGAKPPMVIWTRNHEGIYAFCLLTDVLGQLTGRPRHLIQKPQKPKKQSLEETKSLKFSKFNQLSHHKRKKDRKLT